ncbi:hypothetical protein OBV_12760 [Oscillibacter valericigenes Sjm18-20]|nr:hypothetical protein OBV_12760 [Oscillibacter valericigenes Sjm18-20]
MANHLKKRGLALLMTLIMALSLLPVNALAEGGEGSDSGTQVEETVSDAPSDGEQADAPSDGEQADAPSDGEQADVPSDGEQADVPSDGEQADAPSDGEQADVPSDGEQADVPSDGEQADVPSDGEQADAPSDGEQADAPSDGEQADAPSDGEQADVPGDGEQADAPGDGEQTTDPAAPVDPTAPADPAAPAAPVVEKTPEELAAEEAARQAAAAQAAAAAAAEAAAQAAAAEAARQAAFEAAHPEITGEATYSDTTVYVTAPVGAFAAGTTLSIEPVKNGLLESVVSAVKGLFGAESDTTMSTLLDSIQTASGEDEQTTGAVAFDITFTDADDNEVQPDSEYPVDVRFEVASDSELVTGGQQLQVFHMEDAQSEATPVGEPVEIDPDTQTQSVAVSADSFSIWVIGSKDAKPTVTYIYHVENEVYGQQIVGNQEILNQPQTPDSSDAGKIFSGWYTAKVGGNLFESFGLISVDAKNPKKTVNLYAHFEAAYYVFYMDSVNQNARVLFTEKLAVGKDVDLTKQVPVDTEHACVGWTTDGSSTTLTSLQIGENNVYLYPVIKEAHWITFNTMGGSALAPAYVIKDENTVDPGDDATTKAGYDFAGWYTDEECTQKFSFGENLDSNRTLYAKWEATDVNYTVVYWKELVERGKYEFLGTDTGTEETGTPVNGSWYSKYDLYHSSQFPELKYFHYARADENVEVKGDGSTIVNVYYDRNTYTIRFDLNRGEYVNLKMGGETYWGNSGMGYNSYYTFTARLGDDISAKWPTYSNIYQEYGATPFLGWQIDGEGTCYGSKRFNLTPEMISDTNNNSTTTYKADYYNGYLAELHYMLQNADGSGYTDSELYRQRIIFIRTVFPKEIDGYRNISTPSGGKIGGWYGNVCHYYFYYDRDTYDLKFYNNGSIDEAPSKIRFGASISDKTYTPDKPASLSDAYHFAGWYTTPGCYNNSEFSFDNATMPAGNLLLYAKWTTDTYTVSFNLNYEGASGTPPTQTVTYDGTASEPTDPARGGYTFGGWTLEGSPFNFSTPVHENMTLTARWIKTGSLTVTYMNGDQNIENADPNRYAADSQVMVLNPSPMNLTAPKDSQDNDQNFVGWTLDVDGKTYFAGQCFTMPEVGVGVTLTAKWADVNKTTSLTYDFNKGKDSGGKSSSTESGILNNYSVTLLDGTGLSRTGYSFTVWNTQSNGEGKSFDPKEVKNVGVDDIGTNVLYAQWKANEHNITYQITGDYFATKNFKTTKNVPFESPLSPITDNMEETGYTFSGWTGLPAKMPDEDVVVTGSYSPSINTKYTVKHYQQNVNDDRYKLEDTDNNLTGTTGQTATATAKDYKGFTLNTDAEGTKQRGTIARDGSLVLELYYDRNVSTVTYEYTGTVPTDASALPSTVSYKFGAPVTIAEDATATGYTFNGWENGDAKAVNFTMPDGSVTLTGSWDINTYKLTVEYKYADDATRDPYETAQTPVTYGADFNAEYKTAPTGYKFFNRSVVGYDAGESAAENVTGKMPAGDVTVTYTYAKLGEITMTVKYLLSKDHNMEIKTAKPMTLTENKGGQSAAGLVYDFIDKGSVGDADYVENYYKYASDNRDGNYSFDYKDGAGQILEVYYAVQTYSVTASVKGADGHEVGGSITSTTPLVPLNKGETTTVTWELTEGYELDSVTDGNAPVAASDYTYNEETGVYSYTISDIAADHEVVVSTKPITYSVTFNAGTNGKLTDGEDTNVFSTVWQWLVNLFTTEGKKSYQQFVYEFNVEDLNNENDPATLSAPAVQANDGYTFHGFYQDGVSDPPSYTNLEAAYGIMRDTKTTGVSYTGSYTQNKYTVIYDLKGGETTSTQTEFVDLLHYGDPTPTIVAPTKAADMNYTYTFAGWQEKDNSTTTYDKDNLPTTVTKTVTYEARWTEGPRQINWYVNLAGDVLDDTGDVDGRDVSQFTKSLASAAGSGFTATVGEKTNPGATSADITTLISDVELSNKSPVFNGNDFPKDADVFKELQDNSALLKGKSLCTFDNHGTPVDLNDLNTDNYEIYWYVVKYHGDGWHVDGVLSRKTADLTVTKTFTFKDGDPFVADESLIPEDTFRITLTGEDGTVKTLGLTGGEDVQIPDETPTGPILALKTMAAESDTQTGSVTYTWTVEGLPTGGYTIAESGYGVEDYDLPTAKLNGEFMKEGKENFNATLTLTTTNDNNTAALDNTYIRAYRDLMVTKTTNHTLPTDFQITVAGESRTYTLGLTERETMPAPTFDSATNTYTWTLNVPTGDYTAAESNYTVSGYSVAVTATGAGQYDADSKTDSFEVASADQAIVVNFINSYTQNSTPYVPGGSIDDGGSGGSGSGDGGGGNDTPVVIADNPTPLNPTPGITTEIPDGEVPQTDVPGTEIPDENVPLALAPSTGDNITLWVMAAAVSGIGLVWFAIAGRKRRDDGR